MKYYLIGFTFRKLHLQKGRYCMAHHRCARRVTLEPMIALRYGFKEEGLLFRGPFCFRFLQLETFRKEGLLDWQKKEFVNRFTRYVIQEITEEYAVEGKESVKC